MADPFTVLVANLNSMGVFGFLLPWILTFAIVFLLLKTRYPEDLKIVGIISLVVAFFLIGYGGPFLANFFINLFGLAAIILSVLLVIFLFVTMTGADVSKMFGNKVVAAVLVGIGVIIAAIALGGFNVRISDSVIGIVFIIIVLAIAMLFITKE